MCWLAGWLAVELLWQGLAEAQERVFHDQIEDRVGLDKPPGMEGGEHAVFYYMAHTPMRSRVLKYLCYMARITNQKDYPAILQRLLHSGQVQNTVAGSSALLVCAMYQMTLLLLHLAH